MKKVLFLCALALLPTRAFCVEKEKDVDEEESNSLEVGVKGNLATEGNESGYDWGPTLNLTLVSSPKVAASRFKYGLEADYNDSYTKLKDEEGAHANRVRTFELRYAKVHALQLFGFDLKKRLGFVPYASAGVQYGDNIQELEGERTRQTYWSPTLGAGVEIALNKKVTLAVDYDRNLENGATRVSRLALELKLSLFGD